MTSTSSASSASAVAPLLRPSKYLSHSEEHFAGYFLQLDTFIRRDPAAEDLLTGLLPNPLLQLYDEALAPRGRRAREICKQLRILHEHAGVVGPGATDVVCDSPELTSLSP